MTYSAKSASLATGSQLKAKRTLPVAIRLAGRVSNQLLALLVTVVLDFYFPRWSQRVGRTHVEARDVAGYRFVLSCDRNAG